MYNKSESGRIYHGFGGFPLHDRTMAADVPKDSARSGTPPPPSRGGSTLPNKFADQASAANFGLTNNCRQIPKDLLDSRLATIEQTCQKPQIPPIDRM
jgi:hypothetical protein